MLWIPLASSFVSVELLNSPVHPFICYSDSASFPVTYSLYLSPFHIVTFHLFPRFTTLSLILVSPLPFPSLISAPYVSEPRLYHVLSGSLSGLDSGLRSILARYLLYLFPRISITSDCPLTLLLCPSSLDLVLGWFPSDSALAPQGTP